MFNQSLKKVNTINIIAILFICSVVINLSTINTAFFSDDPGLYGSIAKFLIYKNEFWSLYSYGKDWLDKPHLPFWLIMASFKLLGIQTWTYKLPALFCFLLSLLYTWLFTKKYYGKLTALMAILIVSTSLHIIMSNADVRAEPYLMAFIIGAIYHISNLEKGFSLLHFILAALLTACAIMTKGIFVIAPIYGALGGQLIIQKKYRDIISLKWIALVLLTLILITPELYALYVQFDLHPEKVVFMKQHVSGIKWFLYDSQFGRFSNDGPITRPKGDIFFFMHTLLWALAPWCLLFYYAIFKSIKQIINKVELAEYYTLSGGLVLLVLFSISSFQLPFYTNIIFPLFAVVIANFCSSELVNKAERIFRLTAQWIYIVAFIIVIIALHYFLKPSTNLLIIADGVGLAILAITTFKTRESSHIKLFMLTCGVMLFTGFYINANLYPILVADKGQIKAAEQVNKAIPKTAQVYSLGDQNNTFQFYCNRPIKQINVEQFESVPEQAGSVFYADADQMTYLQQHHISYKVFWSGWDYTHENILPAYINHATRQSTLDKVYLIQKP